MQQKKVQLSALTMDDKEFEKVKKRAAELDSEWKQEESTLIKIRDHFVPHRGKFSSEKANKDGKRNDKGLNNSTGVQAAKILAAGLQSGVTSPARPWLQIKPSIPEIADLESAKIYCDEVQRRQQAIYARSNFYNSTHTAYLELGPFATAVIFIDEDFDDVVSFRTLTAGEYRLGLGKKMQVEKLLRIMEMTLPQLEDEFGPEALSQEMQAELKQSDSEKIKKKVYHLVEPNPKYNPMAHGAKLLPIRYRSIYWVEGEKKPLKVGGYHEKPFVAIRWDVVADQIYGRGLGWEALGDVQQLQVMERDRQMASAKSLNPPLMVPDSIKQVNVMPGGISRYNETAQGGKATIYPTYQVQVDFNGTLASIAEKKQQVNSAFYVDLFTMLSGYTGPQQTAQEVIQKHEEKMIMMGPILERLFSEFLNPIVERVFGIMNRAGLLPEPPEELQGQDLKIEYVSILAQAQKMIGMKSINDLLGVVENVSRLNPEVVQRLDYGELLDRSVEMLGVPAGIVFGTDEYARMQEEQQQAEQEAKMLEQTRQGLDVAGQAAGVAKTLGETPMGGENALQALVGGNAQVE